MPRRNTGRYAAQVTTMPGDSYRKASKILWIAGAATTVALFHAVFAAGNMDSTLAWIVGAIVGCGIQFILTKIEGLLINGVLPAPWNVEWSAGGPVPFMVVGALGCFILDFLLNVAGVGAFIVALKTQTGDISSIGMSPGAMNLFVPVMTIFFGSLLSLGSELLDAVADHVDGIERPVYQMRAPVEREPEPEIVVNAVETRRTAAHHVPTTAATTTDSEQVMAAIRARRKQGGK